MASGAAFTGGASQPATERRKAGDGKCYTFDEFMRYYRDRSFWDRAETEGGCSNAQGMDVEANAAQPDEEDPHDIEGKRCSMRSTLRRRFRRSSAPSPTRLSDRASGIHQEMREWWKKTHGNGYDDQMLSQLASVLFMKRKRVETGDASQPDFAFAPQEETWRAIKDVLELRQRYLRRKGIRNPLHVLNNDQRAEFTKGVREEYEESEEQQQLQRKDVEKGLAKGKG